MPISLDAMAGPHEPYGRRIVVATPKNENKNKKKKQKHY